MSALPWVEDGAPRQGTTVRILKVKDELLLVTGGALSDEERASLFEIHDKLKDVATRVFIGPPLAASRSLIERMYDARVAIVNTRRACRPTSCPTRASGPVWPR